MLQLKHQFKRPFQLPLQFTCKPQHIFAFLLLFVICVSFFAAEHPQKAQADIGTYSSNDVTVLAKMIHGEARGESYIGKVAVGAVILNRVEDKKFPDSVYSVCFQPGAFDAVRDGQYYMTPDEDSMNAAKAAINGWDPTYGALYYWNPDTATSKWIWSRKIITQIGKHVFGV